jgi:hypothetical protein
MKVLWQQIFNQNVKCLCLSVMVFFVIIKIIKILIMDETYTELTLIQYILQLALCWYWLILPFLFWRPFKHAWLWWRRELYEKKQKFIFIEMTSPGKNQKPYSSMEQVLSSIWSIHSSIEGMNNFKKKWWTGKTLQYLCFEVVSVGPHPKFFIRANREHVDAVRTAFYAQYPDMELTEVKDDYTKYLPWSIPNKKWDMYGEDEVLDKEDVFPIKTYTQFFEVKPENIKDEKRMDPLNTLLSGLGHLHENEQMWIQIRLAPLSKKDSDYMKRGQRIVNRLVHRENPSSKSWIFKLMDIVNPSPATPTQKDKKEIIPPEMKLTPREKEVVQAVENKISKSVFKSNIRILYFGEKKFFNSSRKSLASEFFHSFSLLDQNGLKKASETKTKVIHFFTKRRNYVRKRAILRRFVMRETPLYPKQGLTYILNIEEVATIFHPPIEIANAGTSLAYVKNKKGQAPVNLPI